MSGCADDDGSPSPEGSSDSASAPAEAPREAGALEAALTEIEAAGPAPEAEHLAIEELVAQCMAGEGFEYVPAPAPELEGAVEVPDDLAPGTLAYAESYGYGLLTLTPMGRATALADDPNLALTEEMTTAELDAYLTARWGTASTSADEDSSNLTVNDGSQRGAADAGCQGWAERTYDATVFGTSADAVARLRTEVTDLLDDAADDPRVRDREAQWATCMADAGYPDLAAVADTEDYVLAEMDRRVGEVQEQVDAEAPEDWNQAWDEAINAAQDEVAELEVAVATADLRCQEESGYGEIRGQVDREIQDRFMAERGGEIDAWLAAAREASTVSA